MSGDNGRRSTKTNRNRRQSAKVCLALFPLQLEVEMKSLVFSPIEKAKLATIKAHGAENTVGSLYFKYHS